MTQLAELRQQVNNALIAKAQSDPAFRQALLKDAKAAIENEFGVTFPAGFEWRVVEEASTTNFLVLPAATDGEMSDADLAAVAGGNVTAVMASLKLMGEILSNVSKTRSEISMTFARNSRA